MQRATDTPRDLKERLDAERRGLPFMVFRDSEGAQRLITLDTSRNELTIGRAEECDIRIEGDSEVSRLHALIVCRSGSWTVDDSGLSRNGTFANGERIRGHHVLHDRDVLRAGTTEMCFFNPSPESTRTASAHLRLEKPVLTPAQRKVLLAVCRPCRRRSAFARPASNQQIGQELHLSQDTVRTHLRALFTLFGLQDVPIGEKRIRLAEEAFRTGVVKESDLDDDEHRP